MKTSNGSEVVVFSTHDWGAAAEVDVKRTIGLRSSGIHSLPWLHRISILLGLHGCASTRRAPDPQADGPVLKIEDESETACSLRDFVHGWGRYCALVRASVRLVCF